MIDHLGKPPIAWSGTDWGSWFHRTSGRPKPGDLPVEQPRKFAKALGLTIPPGLFATANEVIE
jgi:hypothetical protein